jgi:hypothetical protein
MVIRGEYSSVAVTGEKEGPLALRRGYITPNVPTVSYRRGVKLNFIRPGKPVENAYNTPHVAIMNVAYAFRLPNASSPN